MNEQPQQQPPQPERAPTFEERMERFGKEAGQAGERFGKRAEQAANRWSRDPGVVQVADTAGRVWGLIVLALGLWFFADVTLGFDMPQVAWRDLWPVALIGIGLLVLARGMTRRRA
jgi:cell wall-active antibiotic response 4TMS protein YvqF